MWLNSLNKKNFHSLGILLLALSYFITARFGLSLGAVNQFATLVWPPTGISLAALLLFGGDLWLGIFIGAFFANYVTGATFAVALGIASGNTLEAVVGAWFLRHIKSRDLLDSFGSVSKFIFLSGFLSTLISASIGVASLFLGGVILKDAFGITWRAWWLGDVMGNLVILPFLLAWYGKFTFQKSFRRLAELIAIITGTLFISCVVLTDWMVGDKSNFPHPYLLFPVLMFVALRLRKRSVVFVNLAVSVIALWATATGHGRFISPSLSGGFLLTQIFLGILVISQLLLVSIVTERRKEREALKKSNAQREAILNAALDCIITIDDRGLIVEFNPAAERTFGYSFAQVVGKEMAEIIIPPRLREGHRKGMAHFLSTGEGPVLGKKIELPAIKSNGTEFPVEISIQPLKVAGKQMFTGFLQDISERKLAEREKEANGKRMAAQYGVMSALAESNAPSESASRILSIIGTNMGWDLGVLWMIDETNQLLSPVETWHSSEIQASEFIRVTTERTFSKGIGLPGRVWSNGQPAWIKDVTLDSNFPRAAVAEKEGLHAAFGFPISSGTKFFGVIEFFSSEIRSPDPELLRTVATIGGQVGQFVERVRSQEALQIALHSREGDLETLRQERELRERFVATLSHDLRTPLAAASMGAQALRRTKDAPDSVHRVANRISSSIERADRMIQDLLDANLVRAGQKLPLQITFCNLKVIATESIEELGLTHGNRFVLDAKSAIEGFWDAPYLRRLIDNLAGNAIKYGDPKRPITIRLERADDRVKVLVHNEGPSISENDLSVIFEPFLRTKSANTGTQKGWGLGLTLVRGIAEAHGGIISVQSDQKSGTTFTTELPFDSRPFVSGVGLGLKKTAEKIELQSKKTPSHE